MRLRSLLADRFGGVSIIATLAIPAVLGAAGLAFDLNRGYQQREINQRAADMAALGAAMAFRTANSAAILQPTARDLASANGVGVADVQAEVVGNFPQPGDQSVRVRVASQVPFTLARILGMSSSYSVVAESLATLVTQSQFAAPCYLALASGADALKVTGGATLTAPDCSVAAVGSVNNQGTRITGHDIISGTGDITNNSGSLVAESLRYAGNFSNPTWNSNVPAVAKRKKGATTLADPWANDDVLIQARAQLGTYTALPTLANPTTSNSSAADWNFPSSSPAAPMNAWWNSGTKTYTIPAGTYYIKKLTVGGGVTVKFGNGSKIYINGGFVGGGGSPVDFGDSDVYVNGGFTSGSSGVTFGNGVLWIGNGGSVLFSGTNTKGAGDVQIGAMTKVDGGAKFTMGAGNHSFAGLDLSGGAKMALGDGNFTSTAGVRSDGDGELALGTGNVLIGPYSGTAINLGGSARFFMQDGMFSANGHITTSGGSKIVFGKTANHYINGNMTIAGAALFGAGRYTVNGNFTNGTGGTVWPYTSALTGKSYGSTLEGVSVSGYDMAGVNVSFILAGTLNLAGGAKTKLIASATTVSGAQIADILIDSLTSGATSWTAGSQNTFLGAVHLPNSKVTMSGGNATLSAGQCFTLVASKIEISGGAATGSACKTMIDAMGGSGSSGSIKLVR